MCVIAVIPSGKSVSKETLALCFKNNPDGAGFAFSNKGKVIVKKGFFDFESFFREYEPILGRYDSVCHFRIGTSGGKTERNCHPWQIDADTVLFHNGVIPNFTQDKSDTSDTGHFVEKILIPATIATGNSKIYEEKWFKYLIYTAVGDHNKLVFFNSDGTFCIINEDCGEWNEGSWFSNESYKKERKTSATVSNFVFSSKRERANAHNLQFAVCESSNGRFFYIRKKDDKFPLTNEELRSLASSSRIKPRKLVKQGLLLKVPMSDFVRTSDAGQMQLDMHFLQREKQEAESQ